MGECGKNKMRKDEKISSSPVLKNMVPEDVSWRAAFFLSVLPSLEIYDTCQPPSKGCRIFEQTPPGQVQRGFAGLCNQLSLDLTTINVDNAPPLFQSVAQLGQLVFRVKAASRLLMCIRCVCVIAL